MEVIPGPVIVDTAPRAPQPQPVQALASESQLDEAAVRQAIANAEANNQDPQTITMAEYEQVKSGIAPVPAQGRTPVAAPIPALAADVPQKFLKPDGAVDVDKLLASTKQLDEAIQKKEEAVNKTVEECLKDYQELENRFRNTPNPEKLAANLSAQAPAAPAPQLDQRQLEDIVRRDFNADPLATTARLIELSLEQKFRPIAEREKVDAVRSNIQSLAEKDSRVLHPKVFEAIKAKLASDPDFWKLKNPHKAAWLEVKEEMRLGEPSQAQAQPRLSPVLGGGTPPSAPSNTTPYNPQDVLANLNTLDIRDKRQEALGDAAIRAALGGR